MKSVLPKAALVLAAGFVLYPIVRDCVRMARFASKRRLPIAKPKKVPENPVYVALGSSFAAGPGAGEFEARSVGIAQGQLSYPNQLAHKLGITQYINAASSGELLSRVADEQVRYVQPCTALVTLTAGGNDVDYTRDTMLAGFKTSLTPVLRFLLDFIAPLKPASQRDFKAVAHSFDRVCEAVRQRSPRAEIVIVTYITVLPETSALPPLSERDTAVLRTVARRLFEVTKEAAARNSCLLVDMTSQDHNALSEHPWATGFSDLVPVHPNLAGHTACADDIYHEICEQNIHFS